MTSECVPLSRTESHGHPYCIDVWESGFLALEPCSKGLSEKRELKSLFREPTYHTCLGLFWIDGVFF